MFILSTLSSRAPTPFRGLPGAFGGFRGPTADARFLNHHREQRDETNNMNARTPRATSVLQTRTILKVFMILWYTDFNYRLSEPSDSGDLG